MWSPVPAFRLGFVKLYEDNRLIELSVKAGCTYRKEYDFSGRDSVADLCGGCQQISGIGVGSRCNDGGDHLVADRRRCCCRGEMLLNCVAGHRGSLSVAQAGGSCCNLSSRTAWDRAFVVGQQYHCWRGQQLDQDGLGQCCVGGAAAVAREAFDPDGMGSRALGPGDMGRYCMDMRPVASSGGRCTS